MTRPKRQLHIFLIYAHGDKNTVRRLYRRITRNGLHVWQDEQELLPGQNWKHQIRQAILGSDVIIVCLSNRFNEEGGFRHEELKLAIKKAQSLPEDKIFIIPAKLESCDLPLTLRPWQCVDLFKRNGFRKLLEALQRLAPPG